MEKWHFYDQTKTSAEIVKMLYQEIYDASRSNNAVIIGCNTIGHLGAGPVSYTHLELFMDLKDCVVGTVITKGFFHQSIEGVTLGSGR